MQGLFISTKSSAQLQQEIQQTEEVFCSGLFLSARWVVLSQVANSGVQLIVLPTRESAEYASADLYNLVEGDCIFFLPESGKSVERSNYKSSLGVQRTAAIGRLLNHTADEKLFIVTYPEALEEKIPSARKLSDALFVIKEGEEIPYESIRTHNTGKNLTSSVALRITALISSIEISSPSRYFIAKSSSN